MSWISVITNAGSNLLAQWVSGSILTIASAKAGTGTVATTQLVNQTGLVTEKQTMSIINGKTLTAGVKLKLQMTAPQTAYTLNQIGVYAKIGDGTPVLLALCQNTDGVSIPDAASSPDFLYTFFPTINMSNTGTLNLTIDTSAVVSQDTMEEYAEALSNKKTVVNSSCTDTDYPSAKAVYDANEALAAKAAPHRNLIDNPWFTVNQRGLTSCPSYSFCLDRWRGVGTGYSVVNGMPVLPSGDHIRQSVENAFYDRLVGKTFTWSVMLSDGTVYSGSGVLPSRVAPEEPGTDMTVIDNDYFSCGCSIDTDVNYLFGIDAKTSITIKAVKLELGTESTLAKDVPPNYTEELLKCKRYFQKFTWVRPMGMTSLSNGYTRGCSVMLVTPMRAVPSITLSATSLTAFGFTKDEEAISFNITLTSVLADETVVYCNNASADGTWTGRVLAWAAGNAIEVSASADL